MREEPQMNGTVCLKRGWRQSFWGYWHRLILPMALFWGGALAVSAQTLRLGPMDITIIGGLELAYSSNVDDAYPEDENPDLSTDDFYLTPSLEFKTQQVPFFRNSTFSLAGSVAYENYFERSDLDTELYSLMLNFNTVLPRLTFGGLAGTEYDVEYAEHEYVPGGITRDPKRTTSGNLFANYNIRKLRLETYVDYTEELHDYVEYQVGDNEEVAYFAGIYLDLFTWGSVFYSWERKFTTYYQSGQEDIETTKEFGLTGSIPLTWLAHPKITYTLGIKSKDENDSEEKNGTWEPSHTIRAEDDLKLTKSLTLSGYVQWENKIYDDDIGFTYSVKLEQLLGARARHALVFTQEPESTLGSTTDTEKTTYAYNFNYKDLFIRNLNLGFETTYEESTPLSGDDVETEKTTTFGLLLAHDRQITRQLSRTLSYEYTWEDSNFHTDGAKVVHLVTYGLNYLF